MLDTLSKLRSLSLCLTEVPSTGRSDVQEKQKTIKMKPDKNIKVQVHYMAANKPFEADEPPETTVGQLKATVLNAFGLKEGGGKTYPLFNKKEELTNPSQTLGEIAGDKHDLNLKLEEVLIQG